MDTLGSQGYPRGSGGLERLEEDFRIVRKSGGGRSPAGTSSSLSTPKPPLSESALTATRDLLNGRQTSTSAAELREETSATLAASMRQIRQEVAAQLDSLRQELSSYQDFPSLRADLEVKAAQQQVNLSAMQAQSEQTRLQLSELRSELYALRERQELQVSGLQSDLRRELDALQLSQAQATRELRMEQQAADRSSEASRKALQQEDLEGLKEALGAETRVYLRSEVALQLEQESRRLSQELERKVSDAVSSSPAQLSDEKVSREDHVLKLKELALCVDECLRQMQELKQDHQAETTLLKSRIEASVGDHQAQIARIESCELQQREEQGRLNTESAALKARLQALELRLAAAALEKISAQATSAHQAQEQLEVRMARLEAAKASGFPEVAVQKGLSSQGAATTAPASGSASGRHSGTMSVASLEDSRGQGLAHLVGEMDAELRVELNSRLRILAADLKGEIMSDVAARMAAAEASAGAVEAKLSAEFEGITEDFRLCLENLRKAQLLPRIKSLEEQARRSELVLATLSEERHRVAVLSGEANQVSAKLVGELELDTSNQTLAPAVDARRSQSPVRTQEVDEDTEGKSKMVISSGLRQRLHGLVSALSWTLGQVHPDVAEATPESSDMNSTTNSVSGKGRVSTRPGSEASSSLLPNRSRVAAGTSEAHNAKPSSPTASRMFGGSYAAAPGGNYSAAPCTSPSEEPPRLNGSSPGSVTPANPGSLGLPRSSGQRPFATSRQQPQQQQAQLGQSSAQRLAGAAAQQPQQPQQQSQRQQQSTTAEQRESSSQPMRPGLNGPGARGQVITAQAVGQSLQQTRRAPGIAAAGTSRGTSPTAQAVANRTSPQAPGAAGRPLRSAPGSAGPSAGGTPYGGLIHRSPTLPQQPQSRGIAGGMNMAVRL